MKKILLLLMAATLTLGFTACSDDDDYVSIAQQNADKIRSLGIKTATVYFPKIYVSGPTFGTYNISIEGDFLVLSDRNIYIPLENISSIMKDEDGEFEIYIK